MTVSDIPDIVDTDPFLEKAQSLLDSPELFWEELCALTDALIVGEGATKITLFLTLLGQEQNFVCGPSSLGKTHLVNNTLKLFPEEWVLKAGSLSDQVLKHIDWEGIHRNVRIFYLQEWVNVGEERDKQIRHMSFDDSGMQWFVSVRDKDTGQFTAQEGQVPALGFVTSTTNLSLNDENLTRSWMFLPDSSDEQTGQIIQRDNDFAKYPWKRPDLKDRLAVFHAAVWKLDVKKWKDPNNNRFLVAQPFIDLVQFPKNVLRMRRDRSKIQRLASIITIINQTQRPHIEIDGQTYLVSSASDLALAIRLTEGIFRDTVSGLTERHRKVFDVIRTDTEEWMSRSESRKKPVDEQQKLADGASTKSDLLTLYPGMTTKEISAKILELSQSGVRHAANALVDKGYIYISGTGEGRGAPTLYSIKKEPDVQLEVSWKLLKKRWNEWTQNMPENVLMCMSSYTDLLISLDRAKTNNHEVVYDTSNSEKTAYDAVGLQRLKTDGSLGETGAYEGPDGVETIICFPTPEEYPTEENQSDIPQEEVPSREAALEHQTPREWAKTVLGFFDPELANNGQVRHMDDIIAQWPEHDPVVRETVMRLMEGGLLMEVAPCQYKRVT